MGTPKRASTLKGGDRQPGPGSYDVKVQAYKHAASAFSMGRPSSAKAKPPADMGGPGPETYSPTRAAMYRAPSFSMGKDGRRESTPAVGPGPGSYTASAAKADGASRAPAWVIKPASRGSRSMAKTDNLPGPGHYYSADSDITRYGTQMLTAGSKTWASRNPSGPTAPRWDEWDE